MLVTDASADPRFANNPLVTGDPKIRFYCGVPLRSPEGHGLGTLCVIDRVPRTLDGGQLDSLTRLARVVESVLELRRRLRLVERAAESSTEAQQARQLLVAMVVHDLRSPLSAVGALCTVIASEHPQTKELVDELLAASTKMNHLLSDVLDVSLGEMGKLTIRPATIEVGEFLRESGRAWLRVAESKSQRLSLDLPDAPLELTADRELLARLLDNLVDNALDHGHPGQTVLVRAVPGAGEVRFEVVDQGAPIPDIWTTAIFEPFRRLERNGGPRGRGLGLAFCSAAVKAHGGEIGVVPAPEGNRFFFRLHSTKDRPATPSGDR
jgi:signal transduction histidine kinase